MKKLLFVYLAWTILSNLAILYLGVLVLRKKRIKARAEFRRRQFTVVKKD